MSKFVFILGGVLKFGCYLVMWFFDVKDMIVEVGGIIFDGFEIIIVVKGDKCVEFDLCEIII